jgi:cytochrome c
VKDSPEFDKIALAVALSIFAFILSNAIGGFLYSTHNFPEKPGFQIDISELSEDTTSGKAKGLPEVIDMGIIMSTASAETGKQVFNKCLLCHTERKGEANKVGPNLWGIVGAKVAMHSDFKYSASMEQRGASGKTWTYEDLYRYLYSPKAYVPGTKMAFAGLKKDEERANLIAYLRTLADKPLPLPLSSSPPSSSPVAKH